MAKKLTNKKINNKCLNDEDELDEFIEKNINDSEESESENSTDIMKDDLDISDDEDDIDIIIEIDEDELDDELDEYDDINVKNTDKSNDDIVLSKHKIEGKHSLQYDSIFKGRKDDNLAEGDLGEYQKESIEVDKSSSYHQESIDNEDYIRNKRVKEKVYSVLSESTNINFMNNRRKPSKVDFNNYYSLLKYHLRNESFTNIEIFNELSVYFSDNLFNMFKLLDNKWKNLIIKELQDHIGKNVNSKEITNRNIYDGTEVEFKWMDNFGNDMIITGVVIEADYQNSTFKIDSYENIYSVSINCITKIINNTKYKYNLNKLNNIDFL